MKAIWIGERARRRIIRVGCLTVVALGVVPVLIVYWVLSLFIGLPLPGFLRLF